MYCTVLNIKKESHECFMPGNHNLCAVPTRIPKNPEGLVYDLPKRLKRFVLFHVLCFPKEIPKAHWLLRKFYSAFGIPIGLFIK